MNTIELVKKYLPILDEQYKVDSRSAILDTPEAFIQQTKDAKKIKLAKMDVDGLADYSRNGGFTAGNLDLTWEEHEFTIDRGRALQVDALDNMETFGLAFGRLAGEFQRTQVIPELDAYRFAKYYQNAGTKVAIKITSGDILRFIDDADAVMDDNEVPEQNRILFVNPQVFKVMINDPALAKRISVEDVMDKTVNKKFYYYDGHLIVKVPSARFYTEVTLLNGTSQGQEVGGYTPASGAKVIGMLMVQSDSIAQASKRTISRYWAPTKAEEMASGADGVNPTADAWKFDFRTYHDAWVLDEKIAGIYGATISGSEIDYVSTEDGSYNSSTGVWTKGGTTYKTKLEGATLVVKGTVPYAEADATLGLDAGNRYQVKLSNSAITSKNDLPTGVIARVLRANGEFAEYTKDAFETDGSLLIIANVNTLRTGIAQITWFANETTTYVINTNGAKMGAQA